MRNIKDKLTASIVSVGVVAMSLLFASSAYAATPTMSAFATGNGDNVQLNINGDDNSPVVLWFVSSSTSALMEDILGTTNSSGSFSETVSTSAQNITPSSTFYITVNGQQSASAIWPYSSSSSPTALALSQTNITLMAGQSASVTAANTNGSSLFVSSNSSPSVANVSLNGTQITVSGNTFGSTTIAICLVNSSSNCANINVNVPGATSISFSQNSVMVPVGQSVPVTVSGGTGVYTISSNSDSAVIQSTISSSTVYLYGNASSGSATITVCSTNMSSCGIITATATAGSTSSALSFSQQNPTIPLGQTATVTVSGGSGTYYIASNSNTSIVEASLTGTSLSLYGNTSGTSLLNICVSSGSCATMTVVVSSSGSQLALSQTSLTLTPGQTSSVLVSGGLSGNAYYISSNSSQSAAYGVIVDNDIINVTGVNAGTTNMSICQSSSQCITLYVTVSGSAVNNTNSVAPQLSSVVGVGQTIYLSLSGGSTPYSLSSNPGTVFKATLSGSAVSITGVSVGSSSVNICSSNGSCTPIYIYVITQSTATTNTGTTSGSTSVSPSSGYDFTTYLYPGSKGEAVTMLQKALTAAGVYSGPISGTYGSLTETAVKKYQKENGISQLGVVGPATRALLNK